MEERKSAMSKLCNLLYFTVSITVEMRSKLSSAPLILSVGLSLYCFFMALTKV